MASGGNSFNDFLRINWPSFNLEARTSRSCIRLLHHFNTICPRPKNGTFGVPGRLSRDAGQWGQNTGRPAIYGTVGNPISFCLLRIPIPVVHCFLFDVDPLWHCLSIFSSVFPAFLCLITMLPMLLLLFGVACPSASHTRTIVVCVSASFVISTSVFIWLLSDVFTLLSPSSAFSS